MKRITIFTSLVLFTVIIGVTWLDYADAAKTGSYNFCAQLPAYPECAGWRTESISDNYWFCKYVDLKNYCNNLPDAEKQISLRTGQYCCPYLGGVPLQKILPEDELSNLEIKVKNTKDSVLPLIIWTDKDHYHFGEKLTIYGKFDFTDPTIIKNIHETKFDQTARISEKTFDVDIKLNGREILKNVPVNSYGWFSAFTFLNNSYNFSTQYNLLEVEYAIASKDVPLGGPQTNAVYHFTTGNIAQKDDKFDILLDDSMLPDKIKYEVTVTDSERFVELSRYDLIITRLTTPEGYAIPIDSSFSGNKISGEFSELPTYGEGEYELRVTYGTNTAMKTFEYKP